MNENTSTTNFVCPVCGKEFSDLTAYARHLTQHSDEEKIRKAEEEKQRKADQKKVDAARLEKLKKMYEDAYSTYLKAKEKYINDYGEDEIPIDMSNLFDLLGGLKWPSRVWP